MRIEAAVLDGDEGLRQIGRQILQRDIGAGHLAALRQHAAVERRRSRWSAAAWEFPATGSGADARRPRPPRRRRRSRPTGPAPRPNRPGATGRSAEARFRPALGAARFWPSPCARAAAVVVVILGSCAWWRPSSACRRAAGMRSLGSSRRSASAAARPNSGSLRPPLFFRPHAIRNTPAHTPRRTLTPRV